MAEVSAQRRRAASLCGILAAVLWGLSFPSTKVAVAAIPPMTLTAAQFIVACLALPAIALGCGKNLRIAPRDAPILALGGIVGVTLFFYCQDNGILRLSASESSLIIAMVPVVSVLSDRVFLGTRFPARVYAGSVVSLAGVALIVLRPAFASGSSLRGYLFMFGAVAAWVGYSFATRGVSRRYGWLAVTFWQGLFGWISCLPFAFREARAWHLPGWTVALNVIYLGLMASVAAFGLFVAAIDRLGVGKANVFINLIPVAAVVGGFTILGDRMGGLQWAGGSIVLAGVFWAGHPG
jgi:drug/metabolite transporter (DMT)-like permease